MRARLPGVEYRVSAEFYQIGLQGAQLDREQWENYGILQTGCREA